MAGRQAGKGQCERKARKPPTSRSRKGHLVTPQPRHERDASCFVESDAFRNLRPSFSISYATDYNQEPSNILFVAFHTQRVLPSDPVRKARIIIYPERFDETQRLRLEERNARQYPLRTLTVLWSTPKQRGLRKCDARTKSQVKSGYPCTPHIQPEEKDQGRNNGLQRS